MGCGSSTAANVESHSAQLQRSASKPKVIPTRNTISAGDFNSKIKQDDGRVGLNGKLQVPGLLLEPTFDELKEAQLPKTPRSRTKDILAPKLLLPSKDNNNLIPTISLPGNLSDRPRTPISDRAIDVDGAQESADHLITPGIQVMAATPRGPRSSLASSASQTRKWDIPSSSSTSIIVPSLSLPSIISVSVSSDSNDDDNNNCLSISLPGSIPFAPAPSMEDQRLIEIRQVLTSQKDWIVQQLQQHEHQNEENNQEAGENGIILSNSQNGTYLVPIDRIIQRIDRLQELLDDTIDEYTVESLDCDVNDNAASCPVPFSSSSLIKFLHDSRAKLGFPRSQQELDESRAQALFRNGWEGLNSNDLVRANRCFSRILSGYRHAYQDIISVHFRLACALSMQGDTTFALDHFKQAVTMGLRNFDLFRSDPFLVSLRQHRAFWDILRQLKTQPIAALASNNITIITPPSSPPEPSLPASSSLLVDSQQADDAPVLIPA